MSDRLVQRSDASEFRKRYQWLALFVMLAFVLVVVRLFELQIVEGADYTSQAHENIVRRVPLPTTRGVIRDAQGKVLASSRPAHNVTVVPWRVLLSAVNGKRPDSLADALDTWPKIADVLRLNPDERTRFQIRLKEACAGASWDDSPEERRKSACYRPLLIREDLSRDIVAELKEHDEELPGVDVALLAVRFYPYKTLGAHMLGYVAEIDQEQMQRVRPANFDQLSADEKQKLNPLGYEGGDYIGATGIEHAWESTLRGTRGWEKRVVDARGRYRTGPDAKRLLDEPAKQDPLPGRDLRLSIDVELMTAIEKAMRPHPAGAAVVVDVRTGRILALYSKPDFDPNDLSGGAGRGRVRETFEKLSTDPLRPMLDKTMTGSFQPGSTFKPFSALAALENKILDPEDRERCDGYLTFGKRVFHCAHVHGKVNMHDAISESCNVYFFKLAEAVGMDRIAKIASDFGLGQKTGLGINPEAPGRVPTRGWYAMRYRGQFRIGFTLNTAIGQGDSLVTPLQLALAYAALANGGTVYSPQIVRAIETSDGTVATDFPPRVQHKVHISPENLARVTDALAAVVSDPRGTAYPARDPGLEVSGKTGTAQTGYLAGKNEDSKHAAYFAQNHAWFAAFSPSRAPEIAVVVFLEHGGSGPTQAVPVAMQIIREHARIESTRGPHVAPPPLLPNKPAPAIVQDAGTIDTPAPPDDPGKEDDDAEAP